MSDLRFRKKTTEISLEIRFYDQSPALSLAVADAHSDSGRMRVEFTPHNETDKKQYFRPMLDLVPKGEKGDSLFHQFYLHYDGLWEKSKPYICVIGSKIYLNNEIDEEVSKILGLDDDNNWPPVESLVEKNI